jgi:hypothetical protein
LLFIASKYFGDFALDQYRPPKKVEFYIGRVTWPFEIFLT